MKASDADIPRSDTSRGAHIGHADVKKPINIPANPTFPEFLVLINL